MCHACPCAEPEGLRPIAQAEMFSIRSGTKSEYQVVCHKSRGSPHKKAFHCVHGRNEVDPTYAKK